MEDATEEGKDEVSEKQPRRASNWQRYVDNRNGMYLTE